jgi:rare lipoprotein A
MRHLEGMDIDMRSPSAFIFSALAFSSLVLVASALAEEPAGKPDGNSVVIEGEASYYGGEFHGKKTANGEIFDQNKMTAASKELPLGSKATVTNEETGKSVDVRINDRGPYAEDRVLDVSKGAAKKLDMIEEGTAPVTIEVDPDKQPTEKVREKVESMAEKQNGAGRKKDTAKAE